MIEYHVLNIGCFSRNMFWGEKQDQAYRDAICTSTLIKGDKNIIVDPSLPPEQMAKTLYDRSGLRPDNIDFVFITHAHGDHFVGIECFPNAIWYMNRHEIDALKNSADVRDQNLAHQIQPPSDAFVKDIELVHLPGHTFNTTGLKFNSRDGVIIACGDAVMTRDYFDHAVGHYNSVDVEMVSDTIKALGNMADVIVPGHDNQFLTGRIK